MGCDAGTDACIDVDAAIAFVDGAIDGDARAALEARVDACTGCRRIVVEAVRAKPGHTDRTPHIGRYVIERALGEGGMGVVWLARDPELARSVVIKLVRPDAVVGEGGDELEARLRREAQAMAQLSHANVVQIFDIGRHGERVFLAMELVEGYTLATWTREKKRTTGELLAVFRQVGAGLAAAHKVGLVHRDVKPSNILVDRDGVAKVTDFGLARVFGAAEARAGAATNANEVLTRADEIVGTPAYMAPEQIAGHELDARTDQFALALCILDALLDQSGAKREIGPTTKNLEAALAERDIALPIAAAIARALKTDPAERFATISELLAALSPPERRRRWPALVGVALCVAGAGLWFALRTPSATCSAKAPAQWSAARASVIAALSQRSEWFVDWRATRIAEAIDGAARELGEDQMAVCREQAVPAARDCVPRREAALAAISAIDADDSSRSIAAISGCARTGPSTIAPLAAELRRGVDVERARAIATRLQELQAFAAAGDALVIAGALALRAGQVDLAERDLREALVLGDRAGDDTVRGRALVELVTLARWRGNHKAAVEAANALEGLVARRGARDEDRLELALQTADAFIDLGDRELVEKALDAAKAVPSASTPDNAARIAMLRARYLHYVRLDPAGAAAVLASVTGASPGITALVRTLAVDLALDRGEPARIDLDGTSLADRIRRARTKVLDGDVDGALADLAAISTTDVVETGRIEAARGFVFLAAHRPAEAAASFSSALDRWKVYPSAGEPRVELVSATERLATLFARCDAEIEARDDRHCTSSSEILETLAPNAAVRARAYLQAARSYRTQGLTIYSFTERNALKIMIAAGAPRDLTAPIQWSIAREDEGSGPADRRALATAARETFAAANKTREVDEIDAWLAAHPP